MARTFETCCVSGEFATPPSATKAAALQQMINAATLVKFCLEGDFEP
jgi:hypothetical protein